MPKQEIKNLKDVALGVYIGNNPGADVPPPHDEHCFRKVVRLTGGTQFVFEDVYGDTITVLPANYEDYTGTLYIVKVLAATDCEFVLNW